MTMTICDTTAPVAIAPDEPAELTELVRGHDQRLLERVAPLVRRQSIALDLNSVERIDAAGIAALVTLYTTACAAGHSFTVSKASPRVARILALVGLDRILLSQNAVQTSHCGPRLGVRPPESAHSVSSHCLSDGSRLKSRKFPPNMQRDSMGQANRL
jgi:anti-anti-sigma factor